MLTARAAPSRLSLNIYVEKKNSVKALTRSWPPSISVSVFWLMPEMNEESSLLSMQSLHMEQLVIGLSPLTEMSDISKRNGKTRQH